VMQQMKLHVLSLAFLQEIKQNVSSRHRSIEYHTVLQTIMEIILCASVHQFSSPNSIDKIVRLIKFLDQSQNIIQVQIQI
jgi:hypothetical protein